MSDHANKLFLITELLEKLYAKYPSYVHFDFTLSTEVKGNIQKGKVKYNIYTPEAGHNDYLNYDDFVAFLELLIKDGVKDVAVKRLEEKLKFQQENLVDAQDQILSIKIKLKELEESIIDELDKSKSK